MKRCPKCEAQYDDHVEYCFVDGADLVMSEGAADPLSHSAIPPLPRTMSTTSRLSTLLLLLVGAAMAAMVFGMGITAAVLSLSGSRDAKVTQTTVPDPVAPPKQMPVTEPEPEPEPEPEAEDEDEPEVLRLGFTSTPEGAEVWEGDTLLCTTPCTVEHPDHAPVPRLFVLKASRHRDTEYLVDDPSLPQHVTLRRRAQPTSAPRAPAVAAKPEPVPITPAPSPTTGPGDDEFVEKRSDLLDPFAD